MTAEPVLRAGPAGRSGERGPLVGPHPTSAACLLLAPGTAQASTIRDRNANACDDDARRAHRTNCARSAPVNVNSAFGRPVLDIHRF